MNIGVTGVKFLPVCWYENANFFPGIHQKNSMQITIFLILMTNFGINQYKFFVHWFKRLALQIGLLVLHYRILTSFWVILNLLDLLHPYQNLALFLWIGVHNSTYSTNFYLFVIILPTVKPTWKSLIHTKKIEEVNINASNTVDSGNSKLGFVTNFVY